MRKLSVLILAVAMVGLMAVPAFAKATVLKDISCGVLFNVTNDSQAVQSSSGNSKITCQGELPAWMTAPDQAVHFDNLLCGTAFDVTSNSKLILTPSGKLILKCHSNPSS